MPLSLKDACDELARSNRANAEREGMISPSTTYAIPPGGFKSLRGNGGEKQEKKDPNRTCKYCYLFRYDSNLEYRCCYGSDIREQRLSGDTLHNENQIGCRDWENRGKQNK